MAVKKEGRDHGVIGQKVVVVLRVSGLARTRAMTTGQRATTIVVLRETAGIAGETETVVVLRAC